MRSPVEIWVAAPQNPLFSAENGGFCLKLVRQFDKIRAKDNKISIVMLHIAMSRMKGMDAAKSLRRIDADVPLIFITNGKQYALRGNEVETLDFFG